MALFKSEQSTTSVEPRIAVMLTKHNGSHTRDFPGGRSIPRPVDERLARIEAAGMAFAVEDSMLNGYAPELRGDIKRFERFRTRWLGNDPSSYATIWRMLAAADMQDELARLTCPVLVIGGSLDRVRPPPLAEAVAKSIPGARYVEIRTGHYMSVQTPDLLSDCIHEFLTSVGA